MSSIYNQLNQYLKEEKAVVLWQRFQKNSIFSQLFTVDQLAQAPPLVARAWQQKRLIWHTEEEKWERAEPFFPPPLLYILGGGHVSQALAALAAIVKLPVVVIDDRQEFANKELFPRAKQVICAPFVEALANLELGPSSFVVLATRGHQYDYECLRVLLPKTLAYLGMVGSRKKVQELKQVLEKEGFPPDRLEALHAPIGIPIGALTPAEIGVSILAEIIAEKRRLFPAEETNREVLAAAAELEAAGKQGIMVTIVKTRGSTPRKAGARMLVYPGEQVIGTIGGGKGEAAAKGQALLALAEGENRLCHLDLTNSAAGEEGMVCGGSMDLVLENMALLRAGGTC